MTSARLSRVDPSLTARLLSDAVHVDASVVLVAQGVRVALGTVLALGAGIVSGSFAIGAAAGGGALMAGMSAIDPSGRPRLIRIIATGAGVSVATFLGSVSGQVGWLHVLVTGFWSAGWGLVVAVEPTLTSLGINAILAILIFGRFAADPAGALRLAANVAAGAAAQFIVSALLRRPPKARPELRALASAYAALAAYARRPGPGPISLGEAIAPAESALERSPVHGVRREAWTSLVDAAGRIRLELLGLDEARDRVVRTGRDRDRRLELLDVVRDSAATLLDAISRALAWARAPDEPTGASERLAAAIEELGADESGRGDKAADALAWQQAIAAAEAMAGQVRATIGLLPDAVERAPRLDRFAPATRVRWQGRADPGALLRRLRANLTPRSAAFRHGIRLAGAVTIAAAAGRLLGLQRGYWVGLTAVLVLRPDFASTFTRGFARALGTLVGVGLAALAADTVHPQGVALVAIVGVFTALAGSLLLASYAAFSAAITVAAVFLLAGVDGTPINDAGERLVATLIGAALALTVYSVWPTWSQEEVRRSLAELVEALRRYVAAVLARCADPRTAGGPDLAELDRAVRLARSNAEATVGQSLAEPPSRRVEESWSSPLLAGLRRISLAGHTLRARIEETRDWPATPEVGPLAEAIDRALEAAAEGLRRGAPPATQPSLRVLHRRLAAALQGSRPPPAEPAPATWIAVETDEMVDAVNTVLHLLARERPGQTQPAKPG